MAGHHLNGYDHRRCRLVTEVHPGPPLWFGLTAAVKRSGAYPVAGSRVVSDRSIGSCEVSIAEDHVRATISAL